MDDDEDDKPLIEKTIEAVKDMASSVANSIRSRVAMFNLLKLFHQRKQAGGQLIGLRA